MPLSTVLGAQSLVQPAVCTTATRPASPYTGQAIYDTTTATQLIWNGTAWVATGRIAQVVSTTLTTATSRASATFGDVTGLTVSITPTLSTSKIFVIANVSVGTDNTVAHFFGRLARGGTGIAVATSAGSRVATSQQVTSPLNGVITSWNASFLDSPASTSALTYSVQCMSPSGTIYINSSYTDVDNANYARAVSTITVVEVLA